MASGDSVNLSLATVISVVIISSIVVVGLVMALVLPLAYGVDPTGIGEKIGILSVANDKATVSVNQRNQTQNQQIAPVTGNAIGKTVVKPTDIASEPEPDRQDTVSLIIPPKQSLFYQLSMLRDYVLKYTWMADNKSLVWEFRGERKVAKNGETKHLFSKGDNPKISDIFTVPFEGNFGWYWENKSDQPVTIWLSTKGAYKILGKV